MLTHKLLISAKAGYGDVDTRVHGHASCVDTGTCIDTILMLTTTCWVDVVGVLVEIML